MRRIKILLIALILILGGTVFSSVNAASVQRSLGAQLVRPFTNSKYQFLVPSNITDVLYTVVKIYDADDKVENELVYNNVLYCLRGGKGFGANVQTDGTDISETPISYTELAEMHTNAKEVIAKYKELYNVDLDRTETINGTEINLYNAILWVLDESYLPKDIKNEENEIVYNAAEYKKELLDKAGVPTVQQADITDDDLETIQQLAIWYFANYDEQTAGTNPTVSQATMFPAQFLSINGNDNINDTKANNLDRIYQYLVYGAIDNAETYKTDDETGERTKIVETNKFAETTLNIVEPQDSGLMSYYKIGPFKIESDINERTAEKTIDATSIVLYDVNGSPIDKYYVAPDGVTRSSIYEIVDSNNVVAKQLKKGIEYYVLFFQPFAKGSTLLPIITEDDQYDVSKVKLKITSTYSLSTANFLYATENSSDNQAVVELVKEKVSESDEITTEYYDLALRKFITAINGNILTGTSSRIPKIDLSKLNTIDTRTNKKITTAKYIHSKNALLVENGDKVVYTIRVYNEGELDGKALEITDYLPEGLQLATESEINTKYGWVAGEGNIITTEYLKDTVIKAYGSEFEEGDLWQQSINDENDGLYYADVQVECEVIAQVSDENQDLRNIAEISNDDGDDRDSKTNNVDDENYIPKEDEDGYFPGHDDEDDDDYEDLLLEADSFDLALRKYITEIQDSEDTVHAPTPSSRVPDISIAPLNQGETTADYNHRKDPVEVETGNIVTYRFTVYNEGDIDGYVNSIIDYLPDGLTFDEDSNPKFIEYKEQYEDEELEGKEYAYKIEENKIEILPLNAENLFELEAFKGETLYSESVDVKFKVTASQTNEDQVLTNVATMTYEAKGTDLLDRDSNKTSDDDGFTVPTEEELLQGLPGYKGNEANKEDLKDSLYHYEGQEDDDDFEKIIIKGIPFDLSLRKFITSIKRNGEEVLEEDRTPSIDTTTLIDGTFNRNGQLEYTATYNHSKEPLVVKQGDIITYTLRIYNEGERAGYATEITDYIPEGLALIKDYKTNFDNEWLLPQDLNTSNIVNLIGEDGFYKTAEDVKNLKLEDFENTSSLKEVQLVTGKVNISTKLIDEELLKPFDKTLTEETAGEGWQKAETGEGGLYYKDIQVSCLVIAENTCPDILTNIAEISEDKDEFGNDVYDNDSTPDNVEDRNEDDDDYEPVVLRYFDLALRKFITGVETNGKLTEITTRVPSLSIDEETGNIKYTHPKEPVEVANNDIVIYTLRVYNEGTLAGYAEEITDDVPEGLIFLPEHEINKKYEWKMYDKDGEITDSLEEINSIKTTYLSEEKETEDRDNLIAPYNSNKELSAEEPLNPDYRDVKVAFRVIEPNTSDRIIVNSAQISEDSDDDSDSIPGEWNDEEDDQDKEYIRVKEFDLSLLKWVTQTIVTVDGKTTTTETGFKPNTGLTEDITIRSNKEDEPVAKVEVDKKKLDKTTVKFAYKIRVTNEGEIAGYATEITDFIPKGLEFKAEDNKKYGWVKEGDDKVTTRALETVLLQPGESTELEIVFTWINDKENLGVKTNIAEITEDYNEHNSKDIDSTPENKKDPYEKEQEDDDDFALVVLSIKTGKGASYTILVMTVITMLATGIYLIKKYVLEY